MEGFLVTHMSEGLWSVIHQGQTLSATFKLVPKLSASGLKIVVSIARAGMGLETRWSIRSHR